MWPTEGQQGGELALYGLLYEPLSPFSSQGRKLLQLAKAVQTPRGSERQDLAMATGLGPPYPLDSRGHPSHCLTCR
jgi:hypothetical protein